MPRPPLRPATAEAPAEDIDSAAGRPGDKVDRVVESWKRERPDIDVTPLEVLSRVARLARHLDLARRAAFAGHGLDPWEFDVLAALRRAGKPYQLSPGELVRKLLVTSGTMTNRVDRLTERGLVERFPDPNDRRGVVVKLTPAGTDLVDRSLAALVEREHEILDVLSPADQDALAGMLRVLLLPFDS